MKPAKGLIEHSTGIGSDARFHDAANILRHVAGLGFQAGFRALDFGCGNGLFALDLARAFPGSRVIGLDLTPAQIERTRANASASGLVRVTFEVGDLSSAALGLASFDLVLALQVVQFLDDPLEELSRWRSSLASAGRLMLTTAFVPERDPRRAFARALSRRFIPHTPFWESKSAWLAL